jgi:uncharacterized membrane protein
MGQQPHSEAKKEFQLERLILFSDAVFAIAITLLIIEIKVPEIHEEVSDKLLLQSLGHLIPKFIGFIISFLLIGLYWTVHHNMFGYITSYTPKLLWINLFFLFFIVLMPFSTGFYSEYTGPDLGIKQLKVPMTFYALNVFCVGMMNYYLWRYITKPVHKVTEPPVDLLIQKEAKAKSLIVPIIFLLMLPVAWFANVLIAVYIPMFIPVVMKIAVKRIHKKATKLKTHLISDK